MLAAPGSCVEIKSESERTCLAGEFHIAQTSRSEIFITHHGQSSFSCSESLDIGDLIGCELMARSAVPGKETASSREGCESKPDEKFTFHFDLCFGLVIIFYDLSGQFELNIRFLFEKD